MLLRVTDLKTELRRPDGVITAVDGVALTLARGQTLAVVGESGCGKTILALSILGLLPPGGQVVAGRIEFAGQDLLNLAPAALRAVRGNRIAMVFQEPMSSLNPVLTIGEQVGEPLTVHGRLPRRAVRQRVRTLLHQVGLPDAPRVERRYPHELSGGMRQRAMIAMALACDPDLLIADEPTTALDVTIQAQILALLRELKRQTEMALLLITHDLGVVAELADHVAVMYAGRIVESGATAPLLRSPRHPYTRGLLRCMPRLDGPSTGNARTRLPVIAGEVPDPARRPGGCAFHPRCDTGGQDERCRREAPMLVESDGAACACWLAGAFRAVSA